MQQYNKSPYGDELTHYGVLGMKWGRRKARPVSGRTNNRYGSTKDGEQLTANQQKNRSRAKKVAIGAAFVAGTALLTVGSFKVAKYAKTPAGQAAISRGKEAFANLKDDREYRKLVTKPRMKSDKAYAKLRRKDDKEYYKLVTKPRIKDDKAYAKLRRKDDKEYYKLVTKPRIKDDKAYAKALKRGEKAAKKNKAALEERYGVGNVPKYAYVYKPKKRRFG